MTTLAADQVERRTVQETSASFETIFEEHWPRVCAALYRLVGDRAEAEDLALEAFLRLHRRPPTASSLSEIGGWLYRVAMNLGFNALRARKRRTRYEEEAGYQVLETNPTWDPAAEIERAQERQRVRLVLAQMKPRSARLLVLRHSGLSYAELGETLGIAPGSVGTLLARAEKEFEERFQKLEGA